MIGRRALAEALGSTAAVRPFEARSQPPRTPPMIGTLMLGEPQSNVNRARLAAFRDRLAALGRIEGKTVHIEYRWAANDELNASRYAAQLVALKPAVILANGTPAVLALKKATASIPVVCALVQDPVRLGLVASLERPGNNITGFTYINPEIIAKWCELLAEAAPATKRTALLFDPALNPQYRDYVRDIGPALPETMKIVETPVQTLQMLQSAMEELGRSGEAAVIVPADSRVNAHRKEVAALALQHRLPAVSVYRRFAGEGGLMSYGPDVPDVFRRAAGYCDRVLKGERPADLPMQQPDKFELVVNLRTAKALDLAMPAALLALADGVIE